MILGSLFAAGCSGDTETMGVPGGQEGAAGVPAAGAAGTVPGAAAAPGQTPAGQAPAGQDPASQTPGAQAPGATPEVPGAMEGMNDQVVDLGTDEIVSDCAPGVPATSQVPRLLNRQYDNVLRDLLGVTTVNGGKPSDMLNDDYDGPLDSIIWGAYQNVAAQVAAEVIAGPNKSNFISCDPASVPTCYEDTIRTFGRQAFRRPMTDDDVARFMTLVNIEPAGTPDEIAEALLYSFLISPSFLMVPEMGGTEMSAGGPIALTSHQIAARLALMVWGSVPDEALMDAADAGELATEAQILAQAERMLAVRDKSAPQLAEAHRAYLVQDDQSHWYKIQHPTETFPNYTDEKRPTMQAELDRFFEEIAYTGGSFEDVFMSTTAFVNADTAPLYGLDAAAYGPELQAVDLADRPGFLTRVGFLSSFSSPEVTSPILRGAFITVNILGADPGPPVDNPPTQPPSDRTYTTRREQITALTEPAECTGCHTPLVNPPGFVLENYNAVGEWQDIDPLGGPIDPSATVIIGSQPTEISSAAELMAAIAADPKAKRIYAERLVGFFTDRLPNPNDACTVDQAFVNMNDANNTMLDVLANMTQADSFRLRTVGN